MSETLRILEENFSRGFGGKVVGEQGASSIKISKDPLGSTFIITLKHAWYRAPSKSVKRTVVSLEQ